ncbi:MAG: esterase, partial [Pseudomonadota bacterium]
MSVTIANDPRLDPRIKNIMGSMPIPPNPGDVDSRETMVAEANAPETIAAMEGVRQMMEMCDNEEVAPSAGLKISKETITSQPDSNSINIQYIRPDTDEVLPCVYYIHGGGMQTMSC